MKERPGGTGTPKNFSVLAALEHGPASAMEVARRVGITRQYAHRLLSGLMAHGFVEKRVDDARPVYRLKRMAGQHRPAPRGPERDRSKERL